MSGSLSSLSGVSGVSGARIAATDQRAQLKAVAQQFEAVFARQMIGSMRSANLGDELFGSDAGNQFRDMSDARMADNMASGGALGIADMLLKQFSGRIAEPTEQGGSK